MAQEPTPSATPKRPFPVWIVFLVIAAVAVAAVVFAVTKSSNKGDANNTPGNTNTPLIVDTSDWQTYRNTRYSYEFRYPASWVLADSLDSSVIDPQATDIAFSDSDPNQVNDFRLDTIVSPDCTSARECAQERLPSRAGQSYEGEDVLSVVVIGGTEGIGVTRIRLDSGRWHYRMVYLLEDGVLFYLQGIASPDATGLNDAVINAIFDSMTFFKE